MRNKYVNRAKISESKFRELVRFYSLDLTAIQIAELTGLNRNTVNRYLTEIRKKIATYSRLSSPIIQNNLQTDTEEDENFCILIREFDAKIYTEIIPQRMAFNGTVLKNSVPIAQTGYDLIIHLESGEHIYLGGKNVESKKRRFKLNRIENFWGSAKSRLAKFKGMHSSTFRYHVKECEFRYNHRDKDLYQLLLKIIRKDPLF